MHRFPAFLLLSAVLSACGDAPEASKPAASDAPSSGSTDDAATAADPAIQQIDRFIAEQKQFAADMKAKGGAGGLDQTDSLWKRSCPKPPQLTFTPGKTYLWELETNKGTVRLKLMHDVAPMHVSSTMYLSRIGFYDGLIFHRIITGFMAQGGCPRGDGRGSPGYSYAGEFAPNVRHDRPYLLSMANAGPKTDGSQFFITFVPTPRLDGKHTIFGEVVEGMNVVQAIEAVGIPPELDGQAKPRERVEIKKARIIVE